MAKNNNGYKIMKPIYDHTLIETHVHHENKYEHEVKLIDKFNNVDILDMHLFDTIV
jgi:hypothetical protein